MTNKDQLLKTKRGREESPTSISGLCCWLKIVSLISSSFYFRSYEADLELKVFSQLWGSTSSHICFPIWLKFHLHLNSHAYIRYVRKCYLSVVKKLKVPNLLCNFWMFKAHTSKWKIICVGVDWRCINQFALLASRLILAFGVQNL